MLPDILEQPGATQNWAINFTGALNAGGTAFGTFSVPPAHGGHAVLRLRHPLPAWPDLEPASSVSSFVRPLFEKLFGLALDGEAPGMAARRGQPPGSRLFRRQRRILTLDPLASRRQPELTSRTGRPASRVRATGSSSRERCRGPGRQVSGSLKGCRISFGDQPPEETPAPQSWLHFGPEGISKRHPEGIDLVVAGAVREGGEAPRLQPPPRAGPAHRLRSSSSSSPCS